MQLVQAELNHDWPKVHSLGSIAATGVQFTSRLACTRVHVDVSQEVRLRGGMLQVKLAVQAFLAHPSDSGLQSFEDCAQVVQPFTITTAVDHAAERAAFGTYRHALSLLVLTWCMPCSL